MKRAGFVVAIVGAFCAGAFAQSGAGELLAGKLVDPKVGQWAWYDLVDKASRGTFVIRQAVVDEEKVDGKTGYWLEVEVVPQAGYKTISKMLLTGPASDPRNIQKVITKDGPDPAQTVELPKDAKDESESLGRRKSLGMENVDTKSGPIRAEHVSLRKGDKTIEMWMSEDVKPCGIVRVVSPDGELTLRNRGFGGPDGKSVITDTPGAAAKDDAKKVGTKEGDAKKSEPNTNAVKKDDAKKERGKPRPKVRAKTKIEDGGQQ